MRPYIINNEINGSISMMNKEMLQCVTFYDFETTGICDPGAVSLAIIRQEYGKVVFAKYYLINPEKEIEKNAQKVHKITQDMVCNKPNFADIWPEIKPYISGQIVCGHNVRYDNNVIKRNVRLYELDCDNFQSICTCENARRLISKIEVPNYKLDSVCDYLNVQLETHHDARDDTDACRKVFNKLICMGDMKVSKVIL